MARRVGGLRSAVPPSFVRRLFLAFITYLARAFSFGCCCCCWRFKPSASYQIQRHVVKLFNRCQPNSSTHYITFITGKHIHLTALTSTNTINYSQPFACHILSSAHGEISVAHVWPLELADRLSSTLLVVSPPPRLHPKKQYNKKTSHTSRKHVSVYSKLCPLLVVNLFYTFFVDLA